MPYLVPKGLCKVADLSEQFTHPRLRGVKVFRNGPSGTIRHSEAVGRFFSVSTASFFTRIAGSVVFGSCAPGRTRCMLYRKYFFRIREFFGFSEKIYYFILFSQFNVILSI